MLEKIEDIVREMRTVEGILMVDDSEGPYSPDVEAIRIEDLRMFADRIAAALDRERRKRSRELKGECDGDS